MSAAKTLLTSRATTGHINLLDTCTVNSASRTTDRNIYIENDGPALQTRWISTSVHGVEEQQHLAVRERRLFNLARALPAITAWSPHHPLLPPNMSAKTSGAQPTPDNNNNAKARDHHDGSSGRAFTVEQKAAVLRVRKCKTTAFYDILGLEAVKTSCSDAEIKKAYRKLSLLTHPDKNGYDGADEAFKSEWAFCAVEPRRNRRVDCQGDGPGVLQATEIRRGILSTVEETDGDTQR